MESLINLCDFLCENHDIPKKIVTSQGFFENAFKFKGIICKSNYSNIYTDINPSFNFRIFFNNAEENKYRLRWDQKNVGYVKKT